MTELDTAPDQTPAIPAWEYADAPESKDVVRLQDRYGLFIGGEFVEPKSGKYMATIDPSTEEVLAEVPEAGPEDVDLAVAAARDAFDSSWRGSLRQGASQVAVSDRARAPGARARVRGPRVHERRQADQGVARHRSPPRRGALLLLRGLGRQARLRVPRARREADRRRGTGDPVELPDADGGVEARACARNRQHVGAEARRDDAAHRPAARRGDPAGGAAAGGGQRDHRSGRDGRLARRRRRRQGRVHRLDRGRQADPPDDRRLAQAAHARARRQGGQHRVRGQPARSGRRGRRERDLLQPGPRLLRGVTAPRARADLRPAPREAEGPAADAPGRRPTRQEHRHRRDQLAGAALEDRGAGGRGRRGGRRDVSARVRPARARLLVPTDAVHRRQPVAPDRARGDLRAGPVDPDVPDAGGSRREGEQHAVRPVRGRVDREGLPDPVDGRTLEGRRRVGEHVQPVRPVLAVRRLQGVGLRARGWPARARAISGARRAARDGAP